LRNAMKEEAKGLIRHTNETRPSAFGALSRYPVVFSIS
jgi:ABC-type enterochelin transport system substrate-binding protein